MWIEKLVAFLDCGEKWGSRPAAAGGLALLCASLCSGCLSVPRAADRLFEAGEHRRAAARYEAYVQRQPAGPARERALFRLVLLYSSPETPVHDLERAERRRQELVEEFPGGPYSSWISRQFFLEHRIGLLHKELEARRLQLEELEAELERSAEEGARERSRAEDLELQLDERLAEMRALEKELARAHDEATSRKERMDRLTEALELLKKIDLKRTP